MKPTLPMLAIPLALAAGAWILWPSQGKSLRVAVHEGKVRMETPRGDVEVPVGRVGRAAHGAAPLLLAEAVADEKEREGFLKEAGTETGEPDFLKPAEEPAWKRALKERLRQQVHFQFEDVNFEDAKKYLEVQGRVVINVDRAAREASPSLDDTPIQLASPDEGMPLEDALNYLTASVGLKWTLRDETIVITTEEGLKEEAGPLTTAKPIPEAFQKKLSAQVHFQFQDVHFEDAKKYLEVQGRVAINVDKAARDANPELDDSLIRLASPNEGMSLEGALNYLTQAVGLAWEFRDGGVAITTEARKGKPGPFIAGKPLPEALQKKLSATVHFTFEGVSLKDVLEFLGIGKPGGMEIDLTKVPEPAHTITVSFASPDEGMSLGSALNCLCDAIGARWTVEGGKVLLLPGDEAPKPAP